MHIIVMVVGHYHVHIADENTILKEKHTHTHPFHGFSICIASMISLKDLLRRRGKGLTVPYYFQWILSNKIMIFACDKLQVQLHRLVPYKNHYIKI